MNSSKGGAIPSLSFKDSRNAGSVRRIVILELTTSSTIKPKRDSILSFEIAVLELQLKDSNIFDCKVLSFANIKSTQHFLIADKAKKERC